MSAKVRVKICPQDMGVLCNVCVGNMALLVVPY